MVRGARRNMPREVAVLKKLRGIMCRGLGVRGYIGAIVRQEYAGEGGQTFC